MGNISKHFNRSEFACHCGCGFDTADIGLVELLEKVRKHFGKPVTISSACRCEHHNKSVGGSDDSKHKLGRAADIVVKGKTPDQVADFINQSYPECGMGVYGTFTHLDSRGHKARWC